MTNYSRFALNASIGVAVIACFYTKPTDLLFENQCRFNQSSKIADEANLTIKQFNIRDQFLKHLAIWRKETEFESSPWVVTQHPAYRNMIKLGPSVIPLILAELSTDLDLWFEALIELTGVNPIPAEHAGDLEAMRDDWLSWGRKNGFDV